MSAVTKIEWTEATWNPIRAQLKATVERPDPADSNPLATISVRPWGYHCEPVSPGCKNCYAERMNGRMLPAWGTGLEYAVPNRKKVKIYLDEEELIKPLHWWKPRRIFPCSMTDLFADFVPDGYLLYLFALMGNSHLATGPEATHVFQVLTKRANRMREFVSRLRWKTGIAFMQIAGSMQILNYMPYLDTIDPWVSMLKKGGRHPLEREAGWMPHNIHLGVSVEDQQRADERLPHLLATPAAVHWVSYEPALGPVDFTRLCDGTINALDGIHFEIISGPQIHELDWVVVGGESGPGARPFNIAWARSVIAQCRAARVPVFVKQLGADPREGNANGDCRNVDCTHPDCGFIRHLLKDRKGGDMTEWPRDLRVREFPGV